MILDRGSCQIPLLLSANFSNYAKDSKLKPDAPEFVPIQTSTPPDSVAKAVFKEAVKLQKNPEKEERKAILSKQTGKKTIKFVQADGMYCQILTDVGWSLTTFADTKTGDGSISVGPSNESLIEVCNFSGISFPYPNIFGVLMPSQMSREFWHIERYLQTPKFFLNKAILIPRPCRLLETASQSISALDSPEET